jgi:hypothetical protein
MPTNFHAISRGNWLKSLLRYLSVLPAERPQESRAPNINPPDRSVPRRG